MTIPTRPATGTPDAGALTRKCLKCGAAPGVECSTTSGKPVPPWYLYANDLKSRVRHPGIHAGRMASD